MVSYGRSSDRDELLAEVATMYYEEDLTQAEISSAVGITRSAVSRMLAEAREKGIVQIRVVRSMQFDEDLARAMERRFGLRAAQVLAWSKGARPDELYERLGKAAAQMLASLLAPGAVIGMSWGTAVSATIEALEVPEPIAVKVVQLVGVLGSRSPTSNAQALTERLARKTGGQPFYLYAPFIVDSAHTARSLMSNQNISDALEVARRCDVALLGIGTTDPGFCSLYRGGYISQDELRILRHAGAVGDVNAYHYDLDGHMTASVLRERIVGLPVDDLLAIPARLAVAGGLAKAEAVLGALRGGWINMLAIDSPTAERVLFLDAARVRAQGEAAR